MRRLVRVLYSPPAEKWVPAFVEEIGRGVLYQDLLTALFLAALANGDPHQAAQIYAANRGSCCRAEERLRLAESPALLGVVSLLD